MEDKVTIAESIDAAYFATQNHRRNGRIIEPNSILSQLDSQTESVSRLSRSDLIKLLHVCSLSVNRKKADAGDPGTLKVLEVRRILVGRILDRLSGRCDHLPTSEVGSIMSALSRMYDSTMDEFMFSLCDILASRCNMVLRATDPHSPSVWLARSELQRAIPFCLFALSQNRLDVPKTVLDMSVEIFSLPYIKEVPYMHLSIYLWVVSPLSGDSFQAILEYAVARLGDSSDDMTVLDMVRTGYGIVKQDSLATSRINTLIQDKIVCKNLPYEWDMHGLIELVRFLRNCNEPVSYECSQKISNVVGRLRKILPKEYLAEIVAGLHQFNTRDRAPGCFKS